MTEVPNTLLGKVMSVLTAFGADDDELGFAELGRRTGLPKATLHRLLGDLAEVRLLDRGARGYRLGGHLFQLGIRASVERRLVEVSTPYLEDLYERTHETVHLGLLEGNEVVHAAKIGGHRQASSPSRLGGRMPLHSTAIGKALLAHSPPSLRTGVLSAPLARLTLRTVVTPGMLRRQLATIRQTGVAYEFEESRVGLACVASPVLGHDGAVVAAVSVAGPTTRFDPRAHAASVHAAATGIALTLIRRATLSSGT
ncbi:IclR family transcriptional regulator [Lentzea flaviverrucosa]|uniref:Transcriptional regulator, IclR family n=1 Tax=Lentzea flaviverrucosa TaxID=200379 RepID=A0A1H9XWQ5_9PSEU|nr:IclR family transcriptional regulator [Lentzea flaviverrucosa]RDI17532.1 IclR family transcriptional regulator [Lentzea flaviverrucosa]SES50600.1 transcriptional regulator, IclR family [Lentzea flaviverrucosa]